MVFVSELYIALELKRMSIIDMNYFAVNRFLSYMNLLFLSFVGFIICGVVIVMEWANSASYIMIFKLTLRGYCGK